MGAYDMHKFRDISVYVHKYYYFTLIIIPRHAKTPYLHYYYPS